MTDETAETYDPDTDPENQIVAYSHLPRWRHRILKARSVLEGVTMTKSIGSAVENDLAETPGIEQLEALSQSFQDHRRALTPPKHKPQLTAK